MPRYYTWSLFPAEPQKDIYISTRRRPGDGRMSAFGKMLAVYKRVKQVL
jgi:hypothetical protein